MLALPPARPSRTLPLALTISLLVHALVLLIQLQKPEPQAQPQSRLEARLAPPAPTPPQSEVRPQPPRPAPKAERKAVRPVPKSAPAPRILTARKSTAPAVRSAEPTPKWSVAQKEEMDNFLNELASDAKAQQARPKPDLAERSLAMAREVARESARDAGRHHRDDLADLVTQRNDRGAGIVAAQAGTRGRSRFAGRHRDRERRRHGSRRRRLLGRLWEQVINGRHGDRAPPGGCRTRRRRGARAPPNRRSARRRGPWRHVRGRGRNVRPPPRRARHRVCPRRRG